MVWLGVLVLGALGGLLSITYNIFCEVRSIRRMMNADRHISNEIQTFED